MAKIRGGSNKNVVDFKKKVVKVGRKVKKNNVTTIKVQSKRIQIPLQSQITRKEVQNEKDVLDAILRQLSHYSSPTRQIAIRDLKDFLDDSPHAETYVAMVLPQTMELLYDDERDTRKALLGFFSSILSRFPSSSFSSVKSLMMTYLCSGLTSLLKGVRRDALALTLLVAEKHASLMLPHLHKIVHHILALLVDPSRAAGQYSIAINSSEAVVSRQQSSSQTSQTVIKKGSQSNNLRVALKSLGAILSQTSRLITYSNVNQDDSRIQKRNSAYTNGCLILRPIKKSHSNSWKRDVEKLRRGGADERGLTDLSGSTETSDTATHLSGALLKDLCDRLRGIWTSLAMGQSAIDLETVEVFVDISSIVSALGGQENETHALPLLLPTVFSHFPYVSLEASMAAPGSVQESGGRSAVDSLNIYLCEIAIVAMRSSSSRSTVRPWDSTTAFLKASPLADLEKDACSYLLQHLDEIISDMEDKPLRLKGVEVDGVENLVDADAASDSSGDDLDEDDDEDDDDNDSDELADDRVREGGFSENLVSGLNGEKLEKRQRGIIPTDAQPATKRGRAVAARAMATSKSVLVEAPMSTQKSRNSRTKDVSDSGSAGPGLGSVSGTSSGRRPNPGASASASASGNAKTRKGSQTQALGKGERAARLLRCFQLLVSGSDNQAAAVPTVGAVGAVGGGSLGADAAASSRSQLLLQEGLKLLRRFLASLSLSASHQPEVAQRSISVYLKPIAATLHTIALSKALSSLVALATQQRTVGGSVTGSSSSSSESAVADTEGPLCDLTRALDSAIKLVLLTRYQLTEAAVLKSRSDRQEPAEREPPPPGEPLLEQLCAAALAVLRSLPFGDLGLIELVQPLSHTVLDFFSRPASGVEIWSSLAESRATASAGASAVTSVIGTSAKAKSGTAIKGKHAATAAAGGSKPGKAGLSAYHCCPREGSLRLLMLDLFYYAPFPDLLAAAKTVATSLAPRTTPCSEQEYFLRLLYERRQDLPVWEFVKTMFSMLRLSIKTISSVEGVGSVGSISSTCSPRLAELVAGILARCSSSEAPEKMITFVLPLLNKFAAISELSSAELLARGPEGAGEHSRLRLGASPWSKQQLQALMIHNDVLAICTRLIQPWVEQETDSSGVALSTGQRQGQTAAQQGDAHLGSILQSSSNACKVSGFSALVEDGIALETQADQTAIDDLGAVDKAASGPPAVLEQVFKLIAHSCIALLVDNSAFSNQLRVLSGVASAAGELRALLRPLIAALSSFCPASAGTKSTRSRATAASASQEAFDCCHVYHGYPAFAELLLACAQRAADEKRLAPPRGTDAAILLRLLTGLKVIALIDEMIPAVAVLRGSLIAAVEQIPHHDDTDGSSVAGCAAHGQTGEHHVDPSSTNSSPTKADETSDKILAAAVEDIKTILSI